ncbi:MAG: hypothetical protein LW825_04545 [Candidatus Jidaibacter sp.]|jgi:hypothetical protein|nr:hypothetical protein [Candidatus Jidaibacter sp.]
MLRLILEKSNNSFQVSIGDEGAVVLYTKSGAVQTRLFIKNTEPHNVQKLAHLLSADPDAYISLYLDTMDQSYVQRRVTGTNAFSVYKIAQRQLHNEIPKNYLKTCVSLGKRRGDDWVYTFIAVAYEPPLSKWVEFFGQYENVIEGIYFLPLELGSFIKDLRKDTSPSSSPQKIGWELLISQSKASGFRQSAFLDGEIVFSRIVTGILDPDINIATGNLEQSIVDCVDYMKRLNISSESTIKVYCIVSQEIGSAIRESVLKVNALEVLTSYSAAMKLGIVDVAEPKDKFFDPLFLTHAASVTSHKGRMHVEQTLPIFRWLVFVSAMKKLLQIGIPITVLFTVINLYIALSNYLDFNDAKSQAAIIETKIADKNTQLKALQNKFTPAMPLEKISAIVDLYKFITPPNEGPIDAALKISEVLPSHVRIRDIKWSYFDPSLPRFTLMKINRQIDINDKKDFRVLITMEAEFINSKAVRKDFEDIKIALHNALQAKFNSANVTMDVLSGSTFNITIAYPKSMENAQLEMGDF